MLGLRRKWWSPTDLSGLSASEAIGYCLALVTLVLLSAGPAPAAPRHQIAIFRPATGEWYIRQDDGSRLLIPFGIPGDLPLPPDYDGRGRAQLALFRPATSQWFLRGDDGSAPPVVFGQAGDQPVPADYPGLGRAQIA